MTAAPFQTGMVLLFWNHILSNKPPRLGMSRTKAGVVVNPIALNFLGFYAIVYNQTIIEFSRVNHLTEIYIKELRLWIIKKQSFRISIKQYYR